MGILRAMRIGGNVYASQLGCDDDLYCADTCHIHFMGIS
jgi:hypothetical protein